MVSVQADFLDQTISRERAAVQVPIPPLSGDVRVLAGLDTVLLLELWGAVLEYD